MNDQFEKLDQEFMQKTKSLREKKIAPAILSGFAASVERTIRNRDAERQVVVRPAKRFIFAWAGAPVLAVMLIGVAVVLRLPSAEVLQLASVPSNAALNTSDEISEDIAVLRELGVWTDEDDNTIGVGSEASLEELELTEASHQKQSRLA